MLFFSAFVDCSLHWSVSSRFTCNSSTSMTAPECLIECTDFSSPFEFVPGVPEAKYKCDIEGKWSPPLPFCVQPGNGIAFSFLSSSQNHTKVVMGALKK